MTLEEAIRTIKAAQAEVEWEYPMEYAAAFDMAISALQEKDSLIARLKAEAIKRNVQYMKSGDRYLIGFVDGMRLARSIVDGSIDEQKYVYPSEGMMTLEEAIKHCEEIAELKYDEGNEARLQEQDKYADECIACAAEHRQLVKWLKELKERRER